MKILCVNDDVHEIYCLENGQKFNSEDLIVFLCAPHTEFYEYQFAHSYNIETPLRKKNPLLTDEEIDSIIINIFREVMWEDYSQKYINSFNELWDLSGES